MGKILFCIIIWALTSLSCFAEGLELTDVIKQAREMQIRQNVKDEAIKQVKNNTQTVVSETEKSACEKINKDEILKNSVSD